MKKMKMVIPALALAASMSMTAFAAGEAGTGRRHGEQQCI